jgi:hypothetical protein
MPVPIVPLRDDAWLSLLYGWNDSSLQCVFTQEGIHANDVRLIWQGSIIAPTLESVHACDCGRGNYAVAGDGRAG